MAHQHILQSACETAASAPNPFILLLHVNDNTDDQVLFQAACKRARVPVNWHVTDSSDKAISYLRTLVEQSKRLDVHWPDLILLDILMPGGSGFDVLKYVRATAELQDIPVIIFTGYNNPSFKSEALRLGANWFLLKPNVFDRTVDIAKAIYAFCSQGQIIGPSAQQQAGSEPSV
jgi:two-component system response regulator